MHRARRARHPSCEAAQARQAAGPRGAHGAGSRRLASYRLAEAVARLSLRGLSPGAPRVICTRHNPAHTGEIQPSKEKLAWRPVRMAGEQTVYNSDMIGNE